MEDQNSIKPDKIFDGRSVPCSVKHGLIIQRWLNLAVGDYFVLVNDHDPVRMHKRFSAEWSGAFDWQHWQKGPDEFRVKITRLKANAPGNMVVGCCGGN